ncbi:DNA/RNA non-specific endonuclease [Nonomuraea candida]|uniref:DNA/RNA non-specific endonuclease n=1 Tax=Nonomuraea candida TaxID=359159 RepID=UPI0005BACF8C|nr:DNA/RNA non-specific endonuclease [Nonomuraea candida]
MPATGILPALRRASAAALLLTAGAAAPLTTHSTAPDAAPCERLLKPDHTYRANRQTFTTDDTGRPVEALAENLVDRSAPRGECQSTVGNWAGAGDWNGGHLIAASFHGVSMRYNLVPLRGRQINQGLMKQVEDGARACLEGDGSVSGYRVRLHYPDREALAPDRIEITLSPRVSGVSRQLTFTLPNQVLSASDFKNRQERITETFRAARCGSSRL